MEDSKAKLDQSFRIDDLLKGKLSRENFQIDYLPMFKMLDDTDRKLANKGGLAGMKAEDIWKRIYDFGVISVSLEKADFQTRIDELNAANLKWFTRADELEAENTQLKARIVALEAKD